MIQIELGTFNDKNLTTKIKSIELPDFHTHKVDFLSIEKIAKKYSKYKNFIILANGGSRTTSLALYNFSNKEKNFEFITTVEPSVLLKTASKYKKSNTLIIPISKSGTNVMPLEALFFFMKKNYKILLITSNDRGVLKEIGNIKGYDIAVHPNIGGRFSGRTMCSLLPAKLMGLNIKQIDKGAKDMYKRCNLSLDKNPALKMAAYLYNLEKNGYPNVMLAFYSMKFYGFIPLIVQLVHESFGKNGKGLTFFGDLGPEVQHHTNQRFYGGRKDIVGMYLDVKNKPDVKINVPKELQNIKVRTGNLGDLDKLSLKSALDFDIKANQKEIKRLNIPHVFIKVDKENEYSAGEFLALMHYFTLYSSLLRNVNPFDQPEVEASKDISWEMTKAR